LSDSRSMDNTHARDLPLAHTVASLPFRRLVCARSP
jgi:hypothetical protein